MGGLTVFRLYFVSLCCFMYNVFVLCIVIYCNSVEINIHSFIHWDQFGGFLLRSTGSNGVSIAIELTNVYSTIGH